MKKLMLAAFIGLQSLSLHAQDNPINKAEILEDLQGLIATINRGYVYLDDKDVDMACVNEKYTQKVDDITSKRDTVLLFEYLLNELYDSHISLSTNINDSYRLSAPIVTQTKNGKTFIANIWQTQIENLELDVLGAEVLSFNGVDFSTKIRQFPTVCQNKDNPDVKNWIANKVIAGKYSEPRLLSVKLTSNEIVEWDVDSLQLKNPSALLSVDNINGIGVIRINNSLGNNLLIEAFDQALNSVSDSKALILDLRNTNSGGNTYVAKGIMGRLIDAELPYQKHEYTESWDGQAKVVRSWIEMASPRGKQYKNPVIVLVGRWTGSMGEGLAIGLDGMNRAQIVGTEMKRLAGSDYDFRFAHRNYGYKVIVEKLYHINGTPRETFVPKQYVTQTTIAEDETFLKALALLSVPKA
jgi:hypothetical protein